ncbi:MAG: thioredoxin-like domain-containing protein [Wenzhouxiangellaceae bacterium]
MKRTLILSILLILAMLGGAWLFNPLLLGPGQLATAQTETSAEPLRGTREAPAFPADLDWLNTGGKRYSLDDFSGKVVLLDFWTYGCINCLHIIPDLKRLEEKYAEELVVIGVHSAKFPQEGKTENIRRLVVRYDLPHPVVNDAEMQIWRRYGVRAWPTLVLIDPAGNIVGALSGEGHYDALDQAIGRVLAGFSGEVDRQPLSLELEKNQLADLPLLFPGKVIADATSERIYISDTSHHRIVVTDFTGKVVKVYGNGQPAWRDGAAAESSFAWPQGLALDGQNGLYVADTENHVIRHIDLSGHQVSTIAGTGEQHYQLANSGSALSTAINSPWDVLLKDDQLYIAMAGQHQLWRYDRTSRQLHAFAGSRREELRDGPRLQAGLNQPSGLATDGFSLLIADSEASAIRRTGFGNDNDLITVVGLGLFDFGDRDGKGREVRLQHPLGVAYWDNPENDFDWLIADTYNSKIKWLNTATREVRTIAVTAGVLDEPGGISVSGDRAYIADTNHHAIRILNLTDGTLRNLILTDPDRLL